MVYVIGKLRLIAEISVGFIGGICMQGG